MQIETLCAPLELDDGELRRIMELLTERLNEGLDAERGAYDF